MVNKDQMKEFINCPSISVSAKYELGLDELGNTIKNMFFHGEVNFNDELYITNIRQRNLLKEALKSLKQS